MELKEVNISLYERSVPIPFKHNKLQISGLSELGSPKSPRYSQTEDVEEEQDKLEQQEEVEDKPEKQEEQEEVEEVEDELDELDKLEEQVPSKPLVVVSAHPLVRKLEEYYELVKTNIETKTLNKKSKDWYALASVVINDIIKVFLKERQDIETEIYDLLIVHMLEELLYYDLMSILNYLYEKEEQTLTLFEQKLVEYFKTNEIKYNDITGLLLPKFNKEIKKINYELVVNYKTKNKYSWKPALGEDKNDLQKKIDERKKYIKMNTNIPYGFMGLINKNKESEQLFYKYKGRPGDGGAACLQRNKKIVEDLNALLTHLDASNLEEMKIHDKHYKKEEICILEEFLLRLNNTNKTNGKQWFLTPIEDFLYMEK
jgi:hypothetical protein